MLTFRFMQGCDICDIIFIEKYSVNYDFICIKRHLYVHMTLQNALRVMDNDFFSIFIYCKTLFNNKIDDNNVNKTNPNHFPVCLQHRDRVLLPLFPSPWHDAWRTVRLTLHWLEVVE